MVRAVYVRVLLFFSSRRRHTRWPRDWSSDVCSSDLPLHFGMGEHTHADSVVVIWPDDTVQTIENVAVNQRIEVVQQNAAGKKVNLDRKEESSALAEPLFREVSEEKGGMFTHQEERSEE